MEKKWQNEKQDKWIEWAHKSCVTGSAFLLEEEQTLVSVTFSISYHKENFVLHSMLGDLRGQNEFSHAMKSHQYVPTGQRNAQS